MARPTTGTPKQGAEQRGGDATRYMKSVQNAMKAPFTPSGGGGATSGKGTTGDVAAAGGGRGGSRGAVGGGVVSSKPKARGGRSSVKKPLPKITG